jgi:ribosome-associated protein
MDFGDVVVHIFQRDIREHYALERLWGDAKRVRIPSGQGVRPPIPARSVTARAPRVRKRG